MNDVTRIGNDIGPFFSGNGGRPLGCCAAHSGYDEASGWGSVDFSLLEQLAVQVQPPELGNVTVSVPEHQHPVRAGHIDVRVGCSQACQPVAVVLVRIGRAPPFQLVSRGRALSTAGMTLFQLQFTTAERRALARGLSKHERIVAVAYGVLASNFLGHGGFTKYSAPRKVSITS